MKQKNIKKNISKKSLVENKLKKIKSLIPKRFDKKVNEIAKKLKFSKEMLKSKAYKDTIEKERKKREPSQKMLLNKLAEINKLLVELNVDEMINNVESQVDDMFLFLKK